MSFRPSSDWLVTFKVFRTRGPRLIEAFSKSYKVKAQAGHTAIYRILRAWQQLNAHRIRRGNVFEFTIEDIKQPRDAA